MKQMLLWFGIVYGNLNALVLSLVAVGFGVDSSAGHAVCDRFTADLGTCRVWLLVVVALVFGTSTLLSLRRLLTVRRERTSLPPTSSSNS